MKKILTYLFPFLTGIKVACWDMLDKSTRKRTGVWSKISYIKDFLVYGVTPDEYDFFEFDKLSRKGKKELLTFVNGGGNL